MSEITIRVARPEDAETLVEIYRPYVEKTAISFEVTVPTVEEFRGRIENVLKKYPFLVAERDGKIVGYSYAHDFVGREAYSWSVEVTIYVERKERHTGVGGALYKKLEECLKAMGVLNTNACIGYPIYPDGTLTANSMDFHHHMGYEMVGRFHYSGNKFGKWYDMVWMEKMLGKHSENPAPVKTFAEACDGLL